MANPPESLVLASSSPYRKELLERLRIPFRIVPADLDERSLPGETALSLVRRLSEDKARAGADTEGDVLVLAVIRSLPATIDCWASQAVPKKPRNN